MEICVIKLVVFNGEDFGYWKKLNSETSLEPGMCHLGDCAAGVRDPNDAQQRDPR
jgi:hypothetical protein